MKKLYMLILLVLAGMQVQAAWEGSGSGENHDGVWYAAYQDSYETLNTIETGPTINLMAPGAHWSFTARRQTASYCYFYYSYSSDGGSNWNDELLDLTTSDKSYSVELTPDVNAIRFLTKTGATLRKYVSNIRVTMAQYLENPSKNDLNFGEALYKDEATPLTFTVAWCNVPAMTWEVTGEGADQFEVEVANNAQAGKYNKATFTVRYKHDVVGSHGAYLVLHDSFNSYTKSINLSGETKKRGNTIVWELTEGWKDWNETVRLAATSDNDETDIVYTINKPELVSQEGDIVTFLEAGAGQEVKITASQAANDGYNAAASVTKTFSIKRQQEIIWEAEKVNTNLRLGTSRDIKEYAYAKYATEKPIVFTSANTEVISVDGTTLNALALGDAEIIATIEGDEQNRPAESRKTFVVKEKESVVVMQGEAIIEQNGVWTLHLEEVSGALSSNNTAVELGVLIGDENVAHYNTETKQIEAVALGETTLTLTQEATEEYNAYENIVTLRVERIANTMEVAEETYTRFVEEDIEGVLVIESLNSEGEITAESSDASIAYYDADDDVIYIPNSENKLFDEKEVTITIRQAQTDMIAAAEKTITLTVKKYANKLYVNGKESYSETITANSIIENIEFSSLNEDYDNCPIVCEQLSGASIATYANGTITSTFRAGNAEWRLSQAESRTHLAAELTFSVRVTRVGEATDCYVLDDPTEYSWGTYGEANYEFTEAGSVLTYEIQRTDILFVSTNVAWRVKLSADGSNWDDRSISTPGQDDWYAYSLPIGEDIRYIKFESTAGAGGNHAVRNVKVTRLTYLNAQNGSISTNEKQEGMTMLTGSYSLANGGDLTIKSDNPKFTFGEERAATYTIKDVDCKGGKINIPVYYYSNEAAFDEANIDIYNGVYNTTVHFTAEAKALPKTYGEYEAQFCEGDSVEFAGKWYYEATETPVEVLLEERNIYGGDSIVNLTVIVNPLGYSELYAVQTEGEYFELNFGPWYLRDSEEIVTEHTVTKEDAEEGLWFTQYLTTVAGCDSIVKYIITVELKDPQTPTALQRVEQGDDTVKEFRNGVLYIRRKGTNFTITGAKVQ